MHITKSSVIIKECETAGQKDIVNQCLQFDIYNHQVLRWLAVKIPELPGHWHNRLLHVVWVSSTLHISPLVWKPYIYQAKELELSNSLIRQKITLGIFKNNFQFFWPTEKHLYCWWHPSFKVCVYLNFLMEWVGGIQDNYFIGALALLVNVSI